MNRRILAAFVPLVDCAVLVAAYERGMARERGIELSLVREPSWSSLRDHLVLGHVDCAHALAPLPIASTLGVGHVEAEMLVPYVLSRGGNAITLSAALADEIETRAEATPCASPLEWGRGLARTVAGRRKPLTFGMVHPFSGHNFELRYWLAAAGIHPDQHVRIVAIPPPLMVESLVAGHVDGFCVGEPWSSLAVEHGIGRIVATKAQIFPHGIEKVLAVRPPIADRGVLAALLDALASAAAWVDEPANHAELAELLARPAYVGLGAELVARSLTGRIALGNGAVLADRDFLYFSRYDAGRPAREEALWIYAQMLRWGQLAPHEDLRAKAAAVFRPDLYADGATTDVGDLADEVASAARDVEEYLRRFDLHTPFIDARSSA